MRTGSCSRPRRGCGTALLLSLTGTTARRPRAAPRRSSRPDRGSLGADPLRRPVRVLPRRPTARASTDRGPPLTDEGPAAVDFVLRTGRMPLGGSEPASEAGPGALLGGGDRRPRRVRRRLRRRSRRSPMSTRRRRPRRWRRAVPVELRRVPRGIRRRRGDRRRAGGTVADGVVADRDRSGDPRRPRGDANVPRRSPSDDIDTSPPTSTTCSRRETTAVDEFGGAGPGRRRARRLAPRRSSR